MAPVGSSNGAPQQGNGSQAATLPAAVADPGLQTEAGQNDWSSSSLSVVVVGASGDLAKKKIFPALFALYYEGLLPADFQVFGYARSKMTDAEFRELIARTLTCRIDARAKCAEAQEFFLQRCFYQAVRLLGLLGLQALLGLLGLQALLGLLGPLGLQALLGPLGLQALLGPLGACHG